MSDCDNTPGIWRGWPCDASEVSVRFYRVALPSGKQLTLSWNAVSQAWEPIPQEGITDADLAIYRDTLDRINAAMPVGFGPGLPPMPAKTSHDPRA
jgi:hypothetical protein